MTLKTGVCTEKPLSMTVCNFPLLPMGRGDSIVSHVCLFVRLFVCLFVCMHNSNLQIGYESYFLDQIETLKL